MMKVKPPRAVMSEPGPGTGELGSYIIDSNGTRWRVVDHLSRSGTADRQAYIDSDGYIHEC